MSKSGLYAHFGSKQQLQLDIIHAARVIFEREVIEPALAVTEGRPRLEALCESYLAYIENWVFPGGCFFAGLLAEFDAQTGPPHQAITEDQRDWTDLLESQVVQAQTNGELDHAADPAQLAFELTAAIQLANYYFVLFRDPEVLERARSRHPNRCFTRLKTRGPVTSSQDLERLSDPSPVTTRSQSDRGVHGPI